MAMRGGLLRNKVTIQRPVRTTSGTGDNVVNWETFTTAGASVSPVSAREQLRGNQIETNISHVVNLRYVKGITADMRLQVPTDDAPLILNIQGVANLDNRRRQVQLTCVEVKPR